MDEPRNVPAAAQPGAQVPASFLPADDFAEPHMEAARAAAGEHGECRALTGNLCMCDCHRPNAAPQLVDYPGLGVRSVDPGRPYVAGEVPQTLTDLLDGKIAAEEERARLLMPLMPLLFAARRLLAAQVVSAGWQDWCKICRAHAPMGRPIEHRAACTVGALAKSVEAMVAWQQRAAKLESNPNQKEAATEEETGRGGDGIRPRGLDERVCLKCGARGGEWHPEERPGVEVWLSLLGLNQCVTAGKPGHHIVYTHDCSTRTPEEPREWIIQRCTQKWIGTELQYEDYPVAEGTMTRSEAVKVLERVDREDSVNEFRAHRVRHEGGAR